MSVEIAGGAPKAFARFIDSELKRWGEVVRAANIKLEQVSAAAADTSDQASATALNAGRGSVAGRKSESTKCRYCGPRSEMPQQPSSASTRLISSR